jgi:hypothetical protein
MRGAANVGSQSVDTSKLNFIKAFWNCIENSECYSGNWNDRVRHCVVAGRISVMETHAALRRAKAGGAEELAASSPAAAAMFG